MLSRPSLPCDIIHAHTWREHIHNAHTHLFKTPFILWISPSPLSLSLSLSPPAPARRRHLRSPQETLNVLHLRFTEGNDDLEKLEASLSHKIELTDVPVFDNVYSFQKLAVLQESGCQIDVLALTGIQDSDEVAI